MPAETKPSTSRIMMPPESAIAIKSALSEQARSDSIKFAELAVGMKSDPKRELHESDQSSRINYTFQFELRESNARAKATNRAILNQVRMVAQEQYSTGNSTMLSAEKELDQQNALLTTAEQNRQQLIIEACREKVLAVADIPMPVLGKAAYRLTHLDNADPELDRKLLTIPAAGKLVGTLYENSNQKFDKSNAQNLAKEFGIPEMHPGIKFNTKRAEDFIGAQILRVAMERPNQLVVILGKAIEAGYLPSTIDPEKKSQELLEQANSILAHVAENGKGNIASNLGTIQEQIDEYRQKIQTLGTERNMALAVKEKASKLIAILPNESPNTPMESTFEKAAYFYIMKGGDLNTIDAFISGTQDIAAVIEQTPNFSFEAVVTAIRTKHFQSKEGGIATLTNETIGAIEQTKTPIPLVMACAITKVFTPDQNDKRLRAYAQFITEVRKKTDKIERAHREALGTALATLLENDIKKIEFLEIPAQASTDLQRNQQLWILTSQGKFHTLNSGKPDAELLESGNLFLRITA